MGNWPSPGEASEQARAMRKLRAKITRLTQERDAAVATEAACHEFVGAMHMLDLSPRAKAMLKVVEAARELDPHMNRLVAELSDSDSALDAATILGVRLRALDSEEQK